SSIQLSFGNTPIGSKSAAKTVTLSNLGTEELEITAVTPSGPFGEDASACAVTLAPQNSCDILVWFQPLASGAQSGTLTITDSAPDSPQKVTLTGNEAPWSSRFTRVYVGFAATGASSADTQTQLLLGVDTEAELGGGAYFWFSPRVISLAAPNPQSASGLSESQLFTTALAASPTTLVQALEVAGGPEWMWGDPTHAPEGDADTRTILAGIAGFGMVTPFTPSALAAHSPVLDVPASVVAMGVPPPPCVTPSNMQSDCAEVFVPQSRDRFFYRYNAGVRFKTYYYTDGKLDNRYPGTIDWTFGQDETVSGGKFRGLVMRLDANYPIPFLSHVNVFGSIGAMPFQRAHAFDPVLTTVGDRHGGCGGNRCRRIHCCKRGIEGGGALEQHLPNGAEDVDVAQKGNRVVCIQSHDEPAEFAAA